MSAHLPECLASQSIVNRPKGTGYEARQTSVEETKMPRDHVGMSTTVHNLMFFAHLLCMNYVTNTFQFVSSSVRSKQLLCAGLRPKKRTKTNNNKRALTSFITMLRGTHLSETAKTKKNI